jgi:DNA ligase-1
MREFVKAAEAVAGTTKKKEKVRVLGELLRSLPIREAELAALFLTGRTFAQWDERVAGVGGATLAKVIAEAAGRSPGRVESGGLANGNVTGAKLAEEELGKIYRKHGDLGDMAEAMVREARGEEAFHAEDNRDAEDSKKGSLDISLDAVAQLFEKLAAARTQALKHELLRAAFERASGGDIKYIVKTLTGDLRIGSKESLVEEAIAEAFSSEIEAVRRANLLLGDIGETTRLAAENRLESAKARLFHALGSMLASPVETPEELFAEAGAPVLYVEQKYDGIRAQVHKSADGKVKIFSRTRDEVTEFPELYGPIAGLPGEIILDGEVLAWRDGRPLPFTELQKRLGRKQIDLWMQHDIPVRFIAFDVLLENGELLLDMPLRERKTRLERILASSAAEIGMAHTAVCQGAGQLAQEFRASLEAGHEGIVAKSPESHYTPGRRGRAWRKLKLPYATLDVVVTAAEYGHGKRHKVLSDVTFAVRDGERLLNIGKAYSGLTDQEIEQNTEFFLKTTVEDRGFRRRVEPRIVLEVAFNNIQRSKRHESGFALRFPRIVRMRPDKGVQDIDTLARVEELFAGQSGPGAAGRKVAEEA